MQQYGIYAPARGMREDFPSILLQDAFLPDDPANADIEIRHGELRRCQKRNEILAVAPDANPVLHYHLLETTAGAKRLFMFTKDNIYRWTPGVAAVSFTDVGGAPSLDDMTVTGAYTGGTFSNTYKVVIDGTGTPDTFEWWKKADGDEYVATAAEDVAVTGAAQTLDNGVQIQFAATTAHGAADYWEFTVGADTGSWENVGNSLVGATDATYWSSTTYADKMICTCGNTDTKILACEATGVCAPLDTANGVDPSLGAGYVTSCKWVIEYERYLFLLNTYENGVWYPSMFRYNDIGDVDAWDSGDAGTLSLPGADPIRGAGKHGTYLIVIKARTHHEVWLTTDDIIFAAAERSSTIGTDSPGSIVNGKQGELYWLDQFKSIRELQTGEKSRPIDKTLQLIPTDRLNQAQGFLTNNYGEIYFALPQGADVTNNNHASVLKPGIGGAPDIWTPRTLDITAFGNFQWQYDYTWDTIPYATWDGWGEDSWDGIQNSAGYMLDICGSSNGKSYSLHDSGRDQGAGYTGSFVLSTDLTGGRILTRNKRILRIQLIMRGEAGGTFNLAAKRDFESAWHTWEGSTSLDLTSNKEFKIISIPCDLRAQTFKFKGYGSDPWSLVGMVFDFVQAGDR